jgi:hypothetical protein
METNYVNEGFKILNNLGDEEIIQIPYNLNNILVEEDDIIRLLDQFNVKIDKVHNIEIFRESFTHKSYCKKIIYPNVILEASKKELRTLSKIFDNQHLYYINTGKNRLSLFNALYIFFSNVYKSMKENNILRYPLIA